MRYTIMYSYYFITDDVFINSVVTHGFLIYPHQFSGVFRVHKLPQKKKRKEDVGSGAVRGKVSFLLLSRAFVKVDDSLFITNPCRNQQVRGPACYSWISLRSIISSSSTFLGWQHQPAGFCSVFPFDIYGYWMFKMGFLLVIKYYYEDWKR